MESFYGGRQGSSFIIVKRFDGISIPQVEGSYVYRTGEYAIDAQGDFILPLVEKSSSNYQNYSWKIQAKDGSLVSSEGSDLFPIEYAEGMVQCFERGGETASEVNYGEYVLIDTIENMHNQNNPDNGKVYRRGIDYDYNIDTNPTAGGEYIGQIVGPQGNAPEINMSSILEIEKQTGYQESTYSMEDGVVPGSWINAAGNREYNDEVTYAWVTVKDDYGNISGCLLGFSFPYLVNHFTANSVNPYYNRDSEVKDFNNLNLINRVDSEDHPYFSEWKISVPKGIKGDTSTNLEIVTTCAKPLAEYYRDTNLTSYAGILPNETLPLDMDLYNSENIYAALNYGEAIVYIKMEDTYKTRMRYKQTNFDRIAEGDIEYIDLGDYNTIESVGLSSEGILSVKYTYEDKVELEEAIRWIYLEQNANSSYTKGIEIKDDGSILITYNTLDEQGERQTQEYETVFNWINSVTLNEIGEFEVIYNNNNISNGKYNTKLQWIKSANIEADGTIHFLYNDGTIAYTRDKFLKTIIDAAIDNDAETGIEGTGDQKIHLTYNTGEEQIIGSPINYVMESLITEYRAESAETPAYHLIVLYSDPAYREQLKLAGKCVSYRSEKFTQVDSSTGTTIGVMRDDWFDLGYVRGTPGGLHIIGNVDSLDDLRDSSGNDLAPEDIPGNNQEVAGWAYTLNDTEIFIYDYRQEAWYSIGSINAESILPEKVIIAAPASDTNPDEPPLSVNTLNNNGIWLIEETHKYAI